MHPHYHIHSGRQGAPQTISTPAKSYPSPRRAFSGTLLVICAATLLLYAYLYASGTITDNMESAIYEHSEGIYISGLGEASYVFAQTLSDSVLGEFLGLDNGDVGEAVFVSSQPAE